MYSQLLKNAGCTPLVGCDATINIDTSFSAETKFPTSRSNHYLTSIASRNRSEKCTWTDLHRRLGHYNHCLYCDIDNQLSEGFQFPWVGDEFQRTSALTILCTLPVTPLPAADVALVLVLTEPGRHVCVENSQLYHVPCSLCGASSLGSCAYSSTSSVPALNVVMIVSTGKKILSYCSGRTHVKTGAPGIV